MLAIFKQTSGRGVPLTQALGHMKFLSLLIVLVAGCSSNAPRGVYWSHLHYLPPAPIKGHIPGKLISIDGRSAPLGQTEFDVAPGRRKIEFQCPDTITMDGPATVSADFDRGKTYDFVCTGATAKVVARPN